MSNYKLATRPVKITASYGTPTINTDQKAYWSVSIFDSEDLLIGTLFVNEKDYFAMMAARTATPATWEAWEENK